jgi:hypothetical protein
VSELGPLANSSFGSVNVSTQYDPDTITGFGKRRYNWEYSGSITQELMSRVSVDVAYYRRVQGNFTTTDNLDITPADYQSYCVTAPSDPRLPNGGGQQICGLYDIVPTKFGLSRNNVVTFVDKLGGKQTEVFNGVDIAVNARIRSDLSLTGGVATGNTHFNACDSFVDTPDTGFGLASSTALPSTASAVGTSFAYCDYSTSWLTQAKLNGSYTIPWQDIQLGAVLQNLPGQQILAYWNITSADALASLGRPLSGGANASRAVPLIKPGTMYTPRRTQLDLRIAKNFKLGGGRKRVQVMADIFNLTNSNAAVGATSNAGEPPAAINTTFGSAWLKPLNVLQARYAKIGAQFNF